MKYLMFGLLLITSSLISAQGALVFLKVEPAFGNRLGTEDKVNGYEGFFTTPIGVDDYFSTPYFREQRQITTDDYVGYGGLWLGIESNTRFKVMASVGLSYGQELTTRTKSESHYFYSGPTASTKVYEVSASIKRDVLFLNGQIGLGFLLGERKNTSVMAQAGMTNIGIEVNHRIGKNLNLSVSGGRFSRNSLDLGVIPISYQVREIEGDDQGKLDALFLKLKDEANSPLWFGTGSNGGNIFSVGLSWQFYSFKILRDKKLKRLNKGKTDIKTNNLEEF